MRDPAVILIERAHQSLKCNTHGPISRSYPLPTLSRHALSLCPDICQTETGPTACAAVCSFLFFFFFPHYPPVRSRLARIISYASLNKSARTAITIDTACLPRLSSRRTLHLFRPARGRDTRTDTSRFPLETGS